MKRIKFFWMMPWEIQPKFGEYFRVGWLCGKCIFKSPWLVVMHIQWRPTAFDRKRRNKNG